MDYRTEALLRMRTLPAMGQVALLMDNEFQAGLDALDPDLPCYVEDRAIQACVFYGLLWKIERAG